MLSVRILDENFVLDIDKVTLNDLVVGENVSIYMILTPSAIVPDDGISEGGDLDFDSFMTIPTGYQNATVTNKATDFQDNMPVCQPILFI